MIRPIVSAGIVAVFCCAGSADAIHFYRNTNDGCSAASGVLSDDPEPSGEIVKTIRLGHNYFSEAPSSPTEVLGPVTELLIPHNVTTIKAGEAIEWTWNSSHCHSVQGSSFYSGYHYPEEPPESPQVLPGFFEYPILDDTPTLSYVHTFTEPGIYDYICEHHSVIGMTGQVIVEP